MSTETSQQEKGTEDEIKVKNHRQHSSLTSWFYQFELFLYKPIHPSSFCFLRLLIGYLCIYEILYKQGLMWNEYKNLEEYYNTLFKFHYRNFNWIPILSLQQYRYILWLAAISGFGIFVGLLYRLCTIIFALTFTFVFLTESIHHLNHLYLFCLLSWTLTITEGNTYMALDSYIFSRRNRNNNNNKNKKNKNRRSNKIAYYNVFIIKFTMTTVYLFAAIAKMNYDWIVLAIPLRHWTTSAVGRWDGYYWFSKYFDNAMSSSNIGVAYFMSISGLLYDLLVPFMFTSSNSVIIRWIAITSTIVFHVSNKLIFNIGIFPYLSLALCTIYLDPKWPLQLLYKIVPSRIFGTWSERLKEELEDESQQYDQKEGENKTKTVVVNEEEENDDDEDFKSTMKTKFVTVVVLCLMTYHVVVPLRHHLYYGDVTWNQLGHHFSWRMKLRSTIGYVQCAWILQPEGKLTPIDHSQFLSIKQQGRIAQRADHIEEFAHHVSKWAIKNNHTTQTDHVPVYCMSILQVNYRSPQYYIDPRIDLAKDKLWSTNEEYIVDLLPRDIGPSHPLVPGPFHKNSIWRDQFVDSDTKLMEQFLKLHSNSYDKLVPQAQQLFEFLERHDIIGPPKQKGGVRILDATKAKKRARYMDERNT